MIASFKRFNLHPLFHRLQNLLPYFISYKNISLSRNSYMHYRWQVEMILGVRHTKIYSHRDWRSAWCDYCTAWGRALRKVPLCCKISTPILCVSNFGSHIVSWCWHSSQRSCHWLLLKMGLRTLERDSPSRLSTALVVADGCCIAHFLVLQSQLLYLSPSGTVRRSSTAPSGSGGNIAAFSSCMDAIWLRAFWTSFRRSSGQVSDSQSELSFAWQNSHFQFIFALCDLS